MAESFTAPLAERIFLIEIAAQPPSGAATSGRSDFGDLAWGEPAEPDEIVQNDVVLRYAGAPFRSRPDDSPANTPWEHRLLQPMLLSRALPLAPGEGGIIAFTAGSEVELGNADGGLDVAVQSYAVDGRDVTLRAVAPDAAYADATLLFAGSALSWRIADRQRVVLAVRGKTHLLARALQTHLYPGSGLNDEDGDADLANQQRPLSFGYCSNVTPRLVSAFNQLYQVHDGPVNDIPMVYDGGVELTPGSDHADVATLLAATPSAGTFDTCLAEGYFMLGSNPVYDVTADVEGDKTGGTFATDAAAIAERMLVRGGIDPSEIDGDAFDALSTDQPAPMGYYVRDAISTGDAVADLLSGIGAFVGETAAGLFTVDRLEAPDAADDTISEVAQLDLALSELPAEVTPCIWRLGVTWGVNWTPQNIQLDAANIPAARLAFIKVAARVAVAFDTDRQAIHRMAQDYVGVRPPVRAYFRDEADAQAEAERLLALWAPGRQVLTIDVQDETHQAAIGDQFSVKSSRYGLETGAPCRVFGIAFDAAQALTRLQVLR
ncbi:MAG: hypothetical protein AB7R90_21030 [Reyranellaceae bacterium]